MFSPIPSDAAVADAAIDSNAGNLTVKGLTVGSSWIALQACDTQGCMVLGPPTILVNVVQANRPPQAVGGMDDLQVRVGEAVSASISRAFWDFEGDKIVGYTIAVDDEHLAIGEVNRWRKVVELVGIEEGSTSVVVNACDSNGCGSGEGSLRFNLAVLPPPNQPPIAVGSVDDQHVHVGETISLDVSTLFTDPDGDRIKEYMPSLTDNRVAVVGVDARSGILTVRGVKTGFTLISLDAIDGVSSGVASAAPFRLTVSAPPRTPPTVIGSISDKTVMIGRSIQVPTARAFDAPDRYRITRYDMLLSDEEVAEDSVIGRDGVLLLEGSEKGRSLVTVRACSYAGCTNFGDLSFVLIVTDPDEEPNQSPEVVGALLDRHLRVGEMVTMDVSSAFNDPDDEPIDDYKFSFSHPYRVVGSSITNTGVLTIRGANPGVTEVYISACDDENDCSDPEEMSFTLTVEAPLAKMHEDVSEGL